jgi:hypothetical protein
VTKLKLKLKAPQKVRNRPCVVIHTCNLCYSGGRGRKIMVQGPLRQKCKTLSEKKKLKQKVLGGMAQVIEYLPREHKALTSNPSTEQIKRRKKQKSKNN